MADIDAKTQLALPGNNLVTLTHVVYGLHAFSAIIGVITAAAIVTAFLTGWPSIIAVIINYVKRSEVRGTFLESHFSWQIRTFWWSLLWVVIAGLLFITIIGIPVAWAIVVGVGIWVLYRIVRGWLALLSNKPMPM
jgi:uncharacterized membrane protein